MAGHALKSANSNPAVEPVCKGCHGSSSDSSALVSRGAMGPWGHGAMVEQDWEWINTYRNTYRNTRRIVVS